MRSEGALRISVAFPLGYSGSAAGAPEALPDPVRLHEAFVAAASGGPWAEVEGRVLVPTSEHRLALEWLEQHEPVGIVAPGVRLSAPSARRYRWRASPRVLTESDFEPRAALSGPAIYVWPPANAAVVATLRTLAREVTHVGRADSIAKVEVSVSSRDDEVTHVRVLGRGAGHVMRVPLPGRTEALIGAHREASRHGVHRTGSTGRQVPDRYVTGDNATATAQRRFAPACQGAGWPFEEVWVLPVRRRTSGQPLDPLAAKLGERSFRVTAAVGVHRAIVRAIGEDVPPFVSGREGDGPLKDAGHLAIQFARQPSQAAGRPAFLLGIPTGVSDADRELLLSALAEAQPVTARAADRRGGVRFAIGPPRVRSALPFWDTDSALMRTDVPIVLDAVGRPRDAPWSIEDAVVCSIGYAMRGVLERDGLVWESGWRFRREMVATLRERYGVEVAARHVRDAASGYVHRAAPGELLVAASALVSLGTLGAIRGGFLALGRARHLGGGLLVPDDEIAR
jgi:CRISPR-associated protein Csb2